jgi:diguanylate cyclase (GGDEF)-like protein
MTTRWVVVLEMARPCHLEAIEPPRIEEVMRAVSDSEPAALVAADRYAVQLHAFADGPAAALRMAESQFRDAARRLGIALWDVVRAEAQTQAEFDRECDQRPPLRPSVPDDLADLADPGHLGLGHLGDWNLDRADEGEALLHSVFRDPLTGVASDGLFRDALERSAATGAVAGRVHALAMVDLDQFGELNQRLGRSGGDAVLVEVATRLEESRREGDLLARLDADHFVVLLRNTTPRGALAAAERIVSRVRAEMTVEGIRLSTSGSVGVALVRPDQTGQELLDEAEAAVEIAKRTGGRRPVLLTGSGWPPSFADELDGPNLKAVIRAYLDLLAEVSSLHRPTTPEDPAEAPPVEGRGRVRLAGGRLWMAKGQDDLRVVCSWLSPTRAGIAVLCGGGRDGMSPTEERLVKQALGTARPVRKLDYGSHDRHPGDAGGPVAALAVPLAAEPAAVAVLQFVTEEGGDDLELDAALNSALDTISERLGPGAERRPEEHPAR